MRVDLQTSQRGTNEVFVSGSAYADSAGSLSFVLAITSTSGGVVNLAGQNFFFASTGLMIVTGRTANIDISGEHQLFLSK